jgi:predicted RNA-binding protein associated with RNAse of E/G family
VARTGRAHSVYVFWTEDGRLDEWYVNFERPLRRTPVGVDTFDEKLDLIVRPDGTYRWKDEDELEQAAAAGLLEADAVRAEAQRVLDEWPFPTGWEEWRPDPSWPTPQLPDGWDRV